MSPIYENQKINLGRKTFEDTWLDIIIAIVVLLISNFTTIVMSVIGVFFLLSWPICIFIGFYRPFARANRTAFFIIYDKDYNLIVSKTKKIFNKKTLQAKEVDKLVKSLVTKYLDYQDVLDIIGYTDDTLNHAINLKKKIKKPLPVGSANTKAGETLFYRTHATWSQGAIEGSTLKDIGFFYFSNKRFIFNGSEKSCSINLTRITKVSMGPNYIYLQKTAGQNDIFEIENENSVEYLRFLYNKLG